MILIIIINFLFLTIKEPVKSDIDICWDRVKNEVKSEEAVGNRTTWYSPTNLGWYEVQNRFTHQCLKGDK